MERPQSPVVAAYFAHSWTADDKVIRSSNVQLFCGMARFSVPSVYECADEVPLFEISRGSVSVIAWIGNWYVTNLRPSEAVTELGRVLTIN